MKRIPLTLAAALVAALVAAAPNPVPLSRAPAAPTTTYASFQLISSLNIFNANRVGPVVDSQQVHVDVIALVGTMDDAKGRFAFFNSPDGVFRKTLPVGEAIAEYTVTRIDRDAVVLTRNGKDLTLTMGQQLRRPPGGDWELGPRNFSEAAPAAPDPDASAGESDVVKKMMERRLQNLKQ